MKWKAKPKTCLGAYKIKTRFLFFPTRLQLVPLKPEKYEWRWLELCKICYVYSSYIKYNGPRNYSTTEVKWIKRCWYDDKELWENDFKLKDLDRYGLGVIYTDDGVLEVQHKDTT